MQLEPDNTGIFLNVCRVCVYVTTFYFAYLEFLQMKSNRHYFFELTNWIDIGSAILNTVLMIKHDFFFHSWYGFSTQKHWATLAIALVWYKAFYWMRLFTETAFFINLLTKTLSGISAFSLMTFILLMGIANIMYVLNLDDDNQDTEATKPLFHLDLPYDFANSVLYSYKLTLGEFDTDGFAGEH